MILSRWIVVLVIALVLGFAPSAESFAQEKKPDAKSEEPAVPKPMAEQQKRIDQFVKQLGADSFDEREQAQKELEKIGLPALASVRQAAKSTEAEVARRAGDILERLEELLKASKQLAPKKVHLALK